MSKLMLKLICSTFIASFFVLSAHALQLESACYYNLATGQHQDTDPNKKIEIASLSKILTSHWSLARLGLEHRFVTKLHITSLGKNPTGIETYDLHIEGGFDPVFSRDRLQYVVALLNNNKINNLRRISFDENFIFLDNLMLIAASDSYPHDPSSPRTKNNLTQALTKIANSYVQTRARALKLYQMNLPEALKIKYSRVEFISKKEFENEVAPNERLVEIQSVPLQEILLEMNQRSNNHIADFLFQYLGSANEYRNFARQNLHVDQNSYDIRNGSGNPIRRNDGKFYNSASCTTIVTALQDIKKNLAASNQGLQAIFATVGVDGDPKNLSPVSKNYSSPATNRSVIAKTGTIDPTIGLAGSLLTKNGDILFAILYGTRGPSEWQQARSQILTDITDVLEKNRANPIRANDQPFLSFDNQSLLKK